MEQVENHLRREDRDTYSIASNARGLWATHTKLTVLSQFLSPESLQFNCSHKITIGLTSVGSYEKTTELTNA